VIFNADTHEYLHGTRRVRSVTGMIKAAGLLGPAAAFYSKEAAERGTRVHRACLDFDLGLVPDIQHEEAMYLDSYAQWSDLCRPIWTTMEEPKHSERFDFAGTADRVGTINDRPVIVDFKTGGAASWHGLQLALYDILYDELPTMIRRRLVLHLRNDGGVPQMVEYQNTNDYATAYILLSQRGHNDKHNDAQPQAEP
jgi:hypothetical protein